MAASSSAFVACLYLVALVSCASATSCPTEGGWPNWGNGITNTHQAVGETRIKPSTVHQLVSKWTLPVTSDVTAIPTVSLDGQRVFFPDWNGTIWCVSADTGSVLWRVRLDNLTGIYGIMDAFIGYYTGSVSRNSPALWQDLLFLGDLASGWYLALNSSNGALVWKTLLDPHPQATITMSATVHRDRILIGVSSVENQASANPNFTCCTFRGSMLSLDARTGAIVWKTYTTPVNYTGVAVWGSSPSVDDDLGMVFIGTGNNYKDTPDTLACRSQNIPPGQCILNPNNHVDSLLALRLSDGAIQWGRSFAPGPYNDDAYNLGCTPYYQGYGYEPNANCPDVVGQDADFGQAPMLVSYTVTNDRGRDQVRKLVVAGQKNGMVVALNPANGDLVWARKAGPGGLNGGAQWGSGFDGQRIIVAIANSGYTAFNLTRAVNPGPATTYGGLWTALDPEDGSIVWQTAVPQGQTTNSSLASASVPMAYSPVTVANGVVFVGASTITTGAPNFFALQADTGRILWTAPAAGSAVGSPSVVDGSLYWGSGYRLGKPSKTFYAFHLPNC